MIRNPRPKTEIRPTRGNRLRYKLRGEIAELLQRCDAAAGLWPPENGEQRDFDDENRWNRCRCDESIGRIDYA